MLNDNPNMLVPYYLMSCYLYYECDKNVLSDTQFDTLCKRLLDNWDSINHIHKHLIDRRVPNGYSNSSCRNDFNYFN